MHGIGNTKLFNAPRGKANLPLQEHYGKVYKKYIIVALLNMDIPVLSCNI